MATYRLPVLLEKRSVKGWTVAQLAGTADVAPATVKNAERGQPMSRRTAMKLAGALDCHWEDLCQNPLM